MKEKTKSGESGEISRETTCPDVANTGSGSPVTFENRIISISNVCRTCCRGRFYWLGSTFNVFSDEYTLARAPIKIPSS